ncbi:MULTISPECIES: ABC transporter permease [Ruminococcus]|jgi:ABC-2 type transport system permease protein|uniref:Transport permease protein n=1 Tax=Ruminococcus albus 8 TaxID=246199 RepID=E9SHX0_RUMAL|nr:MULTISPECIES: ABC transporter permease [Ruminococcus]MBE6874394.1 ABC transporter permease [Ruminococcus albus]EGC01228.1 ABC-2 type transporter [Ruminococcus albus 8]MBO5558721.1 ABC transporter permease [Ruminococcus sp.]MBR0530470.1 ABC transporter permease [Ruminococcus sp.]MCC3349499.1 ABC transporter permease [Ruminococcus albus 8]
MLKKQLKTFKKYRFLLRELVKKGIKLKYRRSYLGILWTLLEPLLTTCVLTIVFGTFFGKDDKTFPVYILTGRLLYSFFSTGTKSAMKSIRQHAGMIKKVYVPKYIYPLSSVLFNFVIFAISLIVLVGATLVFGVYPNLWVLTAILPLTMLLLLTFGAGMILSTLSVFFRDLEYLWDVALMLIMYTCAIFYKVEKLGTYQWVFKINPLFAIIKDFRAAVYGQNMFHEPAWVIMPAVLSVLSVLVGVLMFKKNQDKFILHI